jgi:hypothetical protein
MATRSVTKPARATARQITGAQAEKAFRAVHRSPAFLSKEEMGKIDAITREDRHGVTRRLALAVLARTGAEVLDDVAGCDRQSAVAISQTLSSLTDYLEKLHGLAEMMETAQMRMAIALARRKDMSSVLEEAKTPQVEQPTAQS